MDADDLAALKALTNPERLRLVGLLAEGPAPAADLGARLAIPRAAVERHLRRLRGARLVRAAPGGAVELAVDRLHDLGRALQAMEPAAAIDDAPLLDRDGRPLDPADARVVRGYVDGGRLVDIPAHEQKRMVVLRYLREQCFPEEREYPEKEVNQRLALFHPDVAALRRYMIDAGLMTREAGRYRRAG